ncbi:hypothetical protein N492_11875 [Clostridium botulinum B2 267]|uniref:DUF2584 family protein n=1 Tax=Clostridium botulinum TaxID=1491 RepID=UPI0007DE5608|nr:DUF2584 family protein [Clostridium botulinum]KEI87640.1 hypothetical protein N492_11875 [Clostridium botulinum B2 267]NFC86233.1 DUF2584 family protein [Clostridium botulinum]
MGAPYEFNWYLVVADKSEIKEVSDNKYVTVKSEHRIYPINSEIPLIVKNEGCIGIVKILNFTIKEYQTIIEFEYMDKLSVDNLVAKHYYDMYLYMKNK